VNNIGKDGKKNIEEFIDSFEKDTGKNIASLFSKKETLAGQVNIIQQATDRANAIRAETKLF
jgi:hypothetical protein